MEISETSKIIGATNTPQVKEARAKDGGERAFLEIRNSLGVSGWGVCGPVPLQGEVLEAIKQCDMAPMT